MLVIALALFSSCGADRNFKKGEKFLALGEYFDAAAQYKQAYSKSKPKDRTARGLYAMRMAYCYNRINSNGKAIAAYRNAIRYGADSLQTHLDFARIEIYSEEDGHLQFMTCRLLADVLRRPV